MFFEDHQEAVMYWSSFGILETRPGTPQILTESTQLFQWFEIVPIKTNRLKEFFVTYLSILTHRIRFLKSFFIRVLDLIFPQALYFPIRKMIKLIGKGWGPRFGAFWAWAYLRIGVWRAVFHFHAVVRGGRVAFFWTADWWRWRTGISRFLTRKELPFSAASRGMTLGRTRGCWFWCTRQTLAAKRNLQKKE